MTYGQVTLTGARSQESEVRGQESGVRSQKSEVRSQESGVRSQRSEVVETGHDDCANASVQESGVITMLHATLLG